MSDFERWKGILEHQANSDGPLDYKHKVLEGIADLESRLAAAEADANSDASADRNYIAGMQEGFRLGLENDSEKMSTLIASRRKGIREALQATAPEQEGE